MACATDPGAVGDTGLEALAAEPAVLDFGALDVGEAAVAPVTLTNVGGDDLQLQLELPDTVFRLLDPAPRPLRLAPGQAWTAHVVYTASHRAHQDLLVVRSSRQPFGLLVVPVLGEGRDPLDDSAGRP